LNNGPQTDIELASFADYHEGLSAGRGGISGCLVLLVMCMIGYRGQNGYPDFSQQGVGEVEGKVE